jgi:hypothetical protein
VYLYATPFAMTGVHVRSAARQVLLIVLGTLILGTLTAGPLRMALAPFGWTHPEVGES